MHLAAEKVKLSSICRRKARLRHESFSLNSHQLITLSEHVREGSSSRPVFVCLSVCHALILEITDN